MRGGELGEFETERVLAEENIFMEKLLLLMSGSCGIDIQDKSIARISDFIFIGEMGSLTNEPAPEIGGI